MEMWQVSQRISHYEKRWKKARFNVYKAEKAGKKPHKSSLKAVRNNREKMDYFIELKKCKRDEAHHSTENTASEADAYEPAAHPGHPDGYH